MSKPRGLQSHNGTLTDYADISGHHAEGIIFPSHNCTPREPQPNLLWKGTLSLTFDHFLDDQYASLTGGGKESPRCGRE